MSFTNKIKNKLSLIDTECEFCSFAELAGIVRFSAQIRNACMNITTENEAVANRIKSLLSDSLGINAEPEYKPSAKYYRIDLTPEQTDVICAELFMPESIFDILPFECCRRAFLRGAFLGGGSLNDPKKSYHMEFDTKQKGFAAQVMEVMQSLGVGTKSTDNKGRTVVYLKDFDSITAVLGLIGADLAVLDFYSVSVEKELRNEVNRMVNCENANMDKLARSASRHLRAIEKIEKTVGLSALSESLREMAQVRAEHPEDSLKELGERLNPPIGKSGVNHRLERIVAFAQNL